MDLELLIEKEELTEEELDFLIENISKVPKGKKAELNAKINKNIKEIGKKILQTNKQMMEHLKNDKI